MLGPVDLAVAAGFDDPAAAEVTALCKQVISASATLGKAAGLFLSDLSRSAGWQDLGATIFVLGSDQAFLLSAAKTAIETFRTASDMPGN